MYELTYYYITLKNMDKKKLLLAMAPIIVIGSSVWVSATHAWLMVPETHAVLVQSWVISPEATDITKTTSAVTQWIQSAFWILDFLGVIALAFWAKFILSFLMSLPSKVFSGGSGGSKKWT